MTFILHFFACLAFFAAIAGAITVLGIAITITVATINSVFSSDERQED